MKERINNATVGLIKNWKTTIIGVIVVLVSIFLAVKTGDVGGEFVVRLTFALGLIMSSDGVTTKEQKEE